MPDSTMYKLLAFSQRHSVAVIAVTGLLTLFFGYFALQIKMNSNIESLLPPNDKVTKLMEKYGAGLPNGDYFEIAVKSKGAESVQSLTALHTAYAAFEKLSAVHPIITPFSYYTFRMEGRRIAVTPLSGSVAAPVPKTPQEVQTFEKNLRTDPFAKNLIVSPDGRALSAVFFVGKLPSERKFIADTNTILAKLSPYYTTYYTGSTPFSVRTRQYLVRDLPKLFLLAALIILIMYYVGFRAKRAVFLPLAVVTMGTIWCLGFMTLLGYQLTVVSIITPPLVLTLGSSYSIHILNQYYREAKQTPGQRTEIINSIDHVNRTIILAAVTTVFGFLSLLPATMYQLRQFGIATSFGIVACAVLSLFFFPAVLSHLRVPKSFQTNKVLEGFLARTMGHLSQFVLRFRIAILCVLVLIIVAFFISLPHIRYQTDYVDYFPQKDSVVKDLNFINKNFGGYQQMYMTVTAPNGDKNYFLQRKALVQISNFENKLKTDPNVSYVSSFVTYLKYLNLLANGKDEIPTQPGLTMLLSRYLRTVASESGGEVFKTLIGPDFSRLTVSFRFYDRKHNRLLSENDLRNAVSRVEKYASETIDPSLKPQVWGSTLRFLDLSAVMRHDQSQSTIISVVLIFLLTAIAFRSIRFGFFTLVPLATGIMFNFVLMAALGIPLDMTTVMFSSIAIGVGVDDSIHFVLQFNEQLHDTRDTTSAITNTLEVAGRPIVLTTASIVGGLLMLTLGSFQPIVFFGLMVSSALFMTMVGTLVILPVVLYFSGQLLDRRHRAKVR